jgi:hypothetical protein
VPNDDDDDVVEIKIEKLVREWRVRWDRDEERRRVENHSEGDMRTH